MKKILVALFFGLITINSYALSIHIVGEYAAKVFNKFFPDKKVMNDVVEVYNEELEKNEGTISAETVSKISTAAGWVKEEFKEIRTKFRKELVNVDGLPICPVTEYAPVDVSTVSDPLKFCEQKAGKDCITVSGQPNSANNGIICNADQIGDKTPVTYYNCGLSDTKLPDGAKCEFIEVFKDEKVTPSEAKGLMIEWALKHRDDKIECDGESHRKGYTAEKNKNINTHARTAAGAAYAQASIEADEERYRQCVSRKKENTFYEFKFKRLENDNSDFADAVCLIWGLKGGKFGEHSCQDANKQQCDEISAAMDRTFFGGGANATLKGTTCSFNEHPVASSAPSALLNTKAVTRTDLRIIDNIDPLHFYDKKLQINADSDLYKNIIEYLSQSGLPAKQFKCSASFVDNINYYNISKQEYDTAQDKVKKCHDMAVPTSETYGADIARCQRYAPTRQTGDLLICEYDGRPVDFLFKKLDVKWNQKSTAGHQALRCLSEGGDFTGKSCKLASEKQCLDFDAKFQKKYPNSMGVKWDPDMETCVLKDVKYVTDVTKFAEVTGMVALTLVTSLTGGPIVLGLSVVEATALTTEAITENKISDWAENFLVDAAKCKNSSNCANTVMKNHIARVIEGSNQFDETQNKQISRQIERLMGMLDEGILTQIVDKGEAAGYISEERNPDMEKSIRAYYGTKLSTSEKALLTTKKVATVATFATLIGGGIMAGLRQSFKRGWTHIDKVKQAHWVDLKILRESDVSADVYAMSKTGKKAAAKISAKEEAEWRALYEKYAPQNETLEHFKQGSQNDLAWAKEHYASAEEARKTAVAEARAWAEETKARVAEADKAVMTPFTEFGQKYGYDKYWKYQDVRNANKGTSRLTPQTPGLENWTQQEIDDAQKVYDAMLKGVEARTLNNHAEAAIDDAIAFEKTGIDHSTLDSRAVKLKKALKDNDLPANVYGDIDKHRSKLTDVEYKNIKSYVEGDDYDKNMLADTFNKDPEISKMSAKAKDDYQEVLKRKSQNVNTIDDEFGLTKYDTNTGTLVAKNEFVQNFVSKRVSMYEDIITKNPNIYNRAKRWNQLSLEEREKLCKEVFEIADDKLGVKHTEFSVRDLVKDFGKTESVEGLQIDGKVYISSRHFPDMSFQDVMSTLAHEQAHKVDALNPNNGILGSQLANLGDTEGYIQGYAGHDYWDYRRELTEQSSWMITDEMRKAMSRLGFSGSSITIF